MNQLNCCILLVAIISVITIACSDSTTVPSDGIIHPRTEFIPQADSASSLLANKKVNEDVFSNYFDLMESMELDFQIGKPIGSRDEMFGEIMGIVAGENGKIYVLDGRYHQIRVYDENSKMLDVFGRKGRGPTDLYEPKKLKIDEKGRLFVIDRYNMIRVIEMRNQEMRLNNVIDLSILAEDFCVLEDKIFVRGVNMREMYVDSSNVNTIHAYSINTGELLFSFGESYQAPETFISLQMSKGLIACNENTNTLVSTFEFMPYIYGYTTKGELKWIAKVDPFEPMPRVERSRSGVPSIGSFRPDYSTDQIVNIIPVNESENILFQIAHRDVKGINIFNRPVLNTYILNTTSGTGTFLGTNSPFISFITDDEVFAYDMVPYPRAFAYNY